MLPPRPDHENGHDDQLWIGWKWFEYHAKQRIESFKFFILIYSGIVALSFSLMRSPTKGIALFLSALSALVCFIFWQLDVRNRQLIEIGEKIIRFCWERNAFEQSINPVTSAATNHQEGLRYKNAFIIGFLSCGLFSIVLFGLAVYSIVHQVDMHGHK